MEPSAALNSLLKIILRENTHFSGFIFYIDSARFYYQVKLLPTTLGKGREIRVGKSVMLTRPQAHNTQVQGQGLNITAENDTVQRLVDGKCDSGKL